MESSPPKPTQYQTSVTADELNLLELLLVLVRRKKVILLVCAISFVLTCVITLLMPNIYTATARILPPQNEKSGLASILGGMSELSFLAGLSLGSGSSGLYVGMLQSRTVTDAVIDRLDLMNVFGWDTRVDANIELKKKLDTSIGKSDGIITLSIDDKDPDRAANIINTYIEELKEVNVKINANTAGRQRIFLEERLKVVKSDLSKAENALKEFQVANKAIRIDTQASAIIEAIAKLKGELASKEVELGILRSSQTEQNFQVKALREGISQIKDQLRQLEQSSDNKKVANDIFIATSEVPELGMKYAQLLREFKIQETIFELLTKQYEISKVEEAKNTSTIQVLDAATPPDDKSKPRRTLIVFLVTIFSGFLSIIYVFFAEYLKRMSQEDRKRLQMLKKSISFHRTLEKS